MGFCFVHHNAPPWAQQPRIMSIPRHHPILKSQSTRPLYRRYEVYFEDHGVSFTKPPNFSRSISTLTSCQILIRPFSQPVIVVLISIPVMSFGRLHFHISKMSPRVFSGEGCMSVVLLKRCADAFINRELSFEVTFRHDVCLFMHLNLFMHTLFTLRLVLASTSASFYFKAVENEHRQ